MNNYYYYNYRDFNIDDLLPGNSISLSVRAFTDKSINGEVAEAKEAGCKIFTYLPNFWDVSAQTSLEELRAAADLVDGIYINNIGQLRVAKDCGLPLLGDSGLNIFNAETALFFAKQGLKSVTLSYELKDEAAALVRQINQKISENLSFSRESRERCDNNGKKERAFKTEVLWKGRVPAMVSRYCPLAGALGIKKADCGSCEKVGKIYLEDARGEAYPVLTDRKNCTSLILSKEELKLKPCGDIRRITI